MNLLNLTGEEFLMLAEEEAKASINIGRRPHPSAFPGWKPAHVTEVPSATRMESQPFAARACVDRKAS